jgi:TatD DNase family protein
MNCCESRKPPSLHLTPLRCAAEPNRWLPKGKVVRIRRTMEQYPTLDAHGHLAANHTSQNLSSLGYVLAMTLSLEEAEKGIERSEQKIAWGVGCYPRKVAAQEAFEVNKFRELVKKTAIVGEVGLDTGSQVPIGKQVQTFRQVLEVVRELPRLVSIHSYRAKRLVLEELRRTPISTPVLHWWTGSATETTEAVELGCYFSIHSAIARHSKFRTRVPKERMLVESDHGYQDPPAAIPCRIEWVEHLVAQQLKTDFKEVRRLVWKNFRTIIDKTGIASLLPSAFVRVLIEID